MLGHYTSNETFAVINLSSTVGSWSDLADLKWFGLC